MWSPGFLDLRSKTQRGAHPILVLGVLGQIHFRIHCVPLIFERLQKRRR